MIDYFSVAPYEWIIDNEGEEGLEERRLHVEDPVFFSGFARSIGVSARVLRKWKTQFPEFKEAYEICKDLQEEMIVINTMMGFYKTAMGIFTLKNTSGWRDKVDNKHSGSVSFRTLVDTVSKDNDSKSMLDQRDEGIKKSGK